MKTSESSQHPRIAFNFHQTKDETPNPAWQFYDSNRLTESEVDTLAKLDDLKRKGLRQPHEL